MHIKVLGTRQGESRRSHFVSVLVDGVLALDAGSITSALTLEEQAAIRYVLLTHRHYDHIKDLATFGFNHLGRGQVEVCCTAEVRAAAEATVLNEEVWLNFFSLPAPDKPTFAHTPVEPDKPFTLAGYQVRPVRVTHSVPALGYAITSPYGGTLLYSGDSGVGSGVAWASTAPDLMVVEVTYPDKLTDLAVQYGHLSPTLLANELATFLNARGKLPRIAIIHANPYHESEIADEVAALARQLSADIWLPEEGATISVGIEATAPLGDSGHRA